MSGYNAPWFLQQFNDPNTGKPLSGGKINFYYAGSTDIPKATFVDYAMGSESPNPLALDPAGIAPEYFLGEGGYKVKVTRADGSLVWTRDNISGTGGAGSSSSGPGFGALFEKCSFPEDEIFWLPDPTNEWWRDDGCFCWIFPAQNFTTINYIKSLFGANNGHVTGRYSIWGFLGTAATKLVDNALPDSDAVGVEGLGLLNIEPYAFIGVAMDPGHDGGGGHPVRQNQMVYPINLGPSGIPTSFGYIGAHEHNTAFETWPAIKGADVKYLITKWMALGLSY